MPGERSTEINYSELDTMETEALERLLRLDAQDPKGLFPPDMVLHILDVLAERGRQNGAFHDDSIDLAYARFQESGRKIPFRPKAKPAFHAVSKVASVLVILTALFAFSMTGYASRHGSLQGIARWTAEVFSIGSMGTNRQILAETEKLLEKYGSRADLVPTWVPDGFIAEPPLTTETPRTKEVFVGFDNEPESLSFSFTFWQGESIRRYEKSDSEVELFEVGGVTHYLFANNATMQAVWFSDSCECCIVGDVTKDELKQIIQSIYR